MPGSVFNRTTKQFVSSPTGTEAAWPTADWIWEPVFPAGVPDTIPYRHLNTQPSPDDTITEMSQAEKDTVDQAILDTSRDSIADTFDGVEALERAFALAVLDEINLHADRITAILDAIDVANNLGDVKTAIALIPDVPTRTIAQMKTAIRGKLGT